MSADKPSLSEHADAAPIVSIDKLHVHYGAIHAVRGISLEIPRGEVYGFWLSFPLLFDGKTEYHIRKCLHRNRASSLDLKIRGRAFVYYLLAYLVRGFLCV